MSLASSQSQFLKGVANGGALSKNNEGVSGRKTAASTVVARANRGPNNGNISNGKGNSSRGDDDDKHQVMGPSLPQQMVSGIAAASIFANVAIVPVALARGQEVYAEQRNELDGNNPSEVRT